MLTSLEHIEIHEKLICQVLGLLPRWGHGKRVPLDYLKTYRRYDPNWARKCNGYPDYITPIAGWPESAIGYDNPQHAPCGFLAVDAGGG